jgi:hypothetical protein
LDAEQILSVSKQVELSRNRKKRPGQTNTLREEKATMPFLRDFTGQTLQWKRPRFFSTTYHLHAGDQILATLSRVGLSRATSEADEQQWIFQREGQRKVLAYPGNHQAANEPVQQLASIQLGWSWQGDLKFHDSRLYTWARDGKWRPTWSWRGPDNKILLTFKKGRLLEITSAASDLPELAFLALLGFYLTLLREEEDAVVAAASVASFS